MQIKKEINRPLNLPRSIVSRISGGGNKKITALVTKEKRVFLTRFPEKYESIYERQIGRFDRFVPTPALKEAQIDHNIVFEAKTQRGDVEIIAPKSGDLKPKVRNLDI